MAFIKDIQQSCVSPWTDSDQRSENVLWSNLCFIETRTYSETPKAVDNLSQNNPKWKAQSRLFV